MRWPLLGLMLLGACATKHPGLDVLGKYLEAEQQGRYDNAHALLSDEDRRARSLDAFVEDHLAAGAIWLAVARRTSFKIDETREKDARLYVDVVATHPDMKAVESQIPGLPPEAIAAADDPLRDMMIHVERVLASQPFPSSSETLSYALVEEAGTWRVWLGLAQQDRAVRLIELAQTEASENDLAATRKALESVLQIPDDPSGFVAELKDVARKNLTRLDDHEAKADEPPATE
jgi:hypothetical protein